MGWNVVFLVVHPFGNESCFHFPEQSESSSLFSHACVKMRSGKSNQFCSVKKYLDDERKRQCSCFLINIQHPSSGLTPCWIKLKMMKDFHWEFEALFHFPRMNYQEHVIVMGLDQTKYLLPCRAHYLNCT